MVAALAGAPRRGRRARRHVLPRAADRDALVAGRAEPRLSRGRVVRPGPRSPCLAEGRPAAAPERGPARRLARRPDHARDDLAPRDPPLAPSPRATSSSASGQTRSSSSPCRWRTSAGSRPRCATASTCRCSSTTATCPMSLPEFGGMDTGFNYYHGADPGEYDIVVSNSEGGLGTPDRARRAAGRGGLLGRRSRLLHAASGREGHRRLLLRLRRQVPARVDGGARSASPRGHCSRRRLLRSAARTSPATPAPPG